MSLGNFRCSSLSHDFRTHSHNLPVHLHLPNTLHKPIPTRTRMRDNPSQNPSLIEYHTIWPWTTTVILVKVAHDWEFQVRAWNSEWKPFRITVSVRILIRALGLAVEVECISFENGCVDRALVVAYSSACFGAGLLAWEEDVIVGVCREDES